MTLTPEMIESFTKQLQEYLAIAGTRVWLLQKALSDGGYSMSELQEYADALEVNATVINAIVERWALLSEDEPSSEDI